MPERTPGAASPPVWPYLLLAGVVIAFDQLTKWLVVGRFEVGERLAVVTGLFDLTLLYNPGAAFSFLASHGGWQRWFFSVVAALAAAFILYLLMRHRGERAFSLALAFILGGAIGNLIDRLAVGQVVDFLLVHHRAWFFPAFNVADSAITVGAIVLIADELMRLRRPRQTA